MTIDSTYKGYNVVSIGDKSIDILNVIMSSSSYDLGAFAPSSMLKNLSYVYFSNVEVESIVWCKRLDAEVVQELF